MKPNQELLCPKCFFQSGEHGEKLAGICDLTEVQVIRASMRALGLAELKHLRAQRDAYRFFSPGTAAKFHMDAARVLDVLRLLRVAKSTHPYYGSTKGRKK